LLSSRLVSAADLRWPASASVWTQAGFAINGSRGQDNLITFDGAPAIRTRANGTSIGAADVETIQEIQVLTANYNAEYGRSAGGQIRMVTKSGTRDFHGSFYEYFRNDKLDANTWARNRAGQPRETRRFNQFGYVLSGPVYIPRVFNQGSQQAVLPLGPGVGSVSATGDGYSSGTVPPDAAG
jgi:hypothetical protein